MLYVITGPPASGKSTWITAHAKPGDIVIDLDRIALAFTAPGAPSWDHSDILLKVAHKARYAAIHEALQHLDGTDVYLIHTMPKPRDRALYRRLKARIVVVDPGREVTAQRIRDMRKPGLQAVATRWYRQHKESSPQVVTAPKPSRQW